jgi:hypothetical protein
MLSRVVSQKLTNVSEAFTALKMEAVSISETSVNVYDSTWGNTQEDSLLHIRRREKLNLTNSLNLHSFSIWYESNARDLDF